MRCQHFKRTPVRLGAFMRKRCATNIWLTFALLILGLCGCDKSTQPLPLLAAEQIPTELQKAFRKAKPELNNVVAQINSELQSKDYSCEPHRPRATKKLLKCSNSNRETDKPCTRTATSPTTTAAMPAHESFELDPQALPASATPNFSWVCGHSQLALNPFSGFPCPRNFANPVKTLPCVSAKNPQPKLLL